MAFVASFDKRVRVLQDFTSSRADLQTALDDLAIPREFATLLFEAVRASSEELMRKREGRKAYIILSDSVSFRDPSSIGTAIEYAQRADTITYSILFADRPSFRGPGRAVGNSIERKRGRGAMQRLARETGGAFFEVSSKQPIEKTYDDIEETLRNQYSIGYPPSTSANKGYRRSRLTVKRPNLVVLTRDGYYGK